MKTREPAKLWDFLTGIQFYKSNNVNIWATRSYTQKSANLWMSHILTDMKINHLQPSLTFPSWKSLS